MADMLSQEEIDALLGSDDSNESSMESDSQDSGIDGEQQSDTSSSSSEVLNTEQKDILGEISNISMGTAATTLFTLLNNKVWITTPTVFTITWKEFVNLHDRPSVGIKVGYKEGIVGSNILVLTQKDVKIITNLMMGGDGKSELEGELTEIDLSAIGEAMNQMIGSAATSLSSMMNTKIDIDTPKAFTIEFDQDNAFEEMGPEFKSDDVLVCISFKMEIGELIDSNIMQILPLSFALDMVSSIKDKMDYELPEDVIIPPKMGNEIEPTPPVQMPETNDNLPTPEVELAQEPPPAPVSQTVAPPPNQYVEQEASSMVYNTQTLEQQPNVNVRPAQFQDFDYNSVVQQKENISIIRDVPLEVTVELGRTRKKIKEILEFGPGTIIELDKLAGEAIEVFVNGKYVAKGEVVVIDEKFGIRITDIVSTEERI